MTDLIHGARDAIRCFAIDGELVGVAPYHRGHIHDTFVSDCREAFGVRRYLLQRMNEAVFQDIDGLMHNIDLVIRHLEERLRRPGVDDGFHALRLIPTLDGASYARTASGAWRIYRFVENTRSFDLCRSERQAFEAARAFGRFQAYLSDLDPAGLRETIPDFFSTPHRLKQFQAALAADPVGRAASCRKEIDAALSRAKMAPVFLDLIAEGRIPMRIVHGDTKLNNVLFDASSARAVSIVDLDTCMPAYSLYDFGDLVRFTAATSAEDERDLDRVDVNIGLYRALIEGYHEATRGFLTAEEQELMPFSARLVTYTIGLRFLTDHLNGDTYFKTEREGHNLDRARVQLRLLERMEARELEMSHRGPDGVSRRKPLQ